MKRTFYVMMAIGLTMSAGARADGPDYEGTVSYIQSRISSSLIEQKHCVFGTALPASKDEHVFNAGALDIVPSVLNASEVHFDCRKGAQCVSRGTQDKKTVVNFKVHDDSEGVAIAISRLIEMCTATAGITY